MKITKERLRAISRKREELYALGWTVADVVEACLESEIDGRNRRGRNNRNNRTHLPYACRTSPHKLAKYAQLLVRCNLPRTQFPEDAARAA
jgi:predicted anti-sigma-YlaC factor YlaD